MDFSVVSIIAAKKVVPVIRVTADKGELEQTTGDAVKRIWNGDVDKKGLWILVSH
jgi:hypothetical protein